MEVEEATAGIENRAVLLNPSLAESSPLPYLMSAGISVLTTATTNPRQMGAR